ncbi:MAG: hypothetical protein NVS1B11_05800 [Terriglobales bacterium]
MDSLLAPRLKGCIKQSPKTSPASKATGAEINPVEERTMPKINSDLEIIFQSTVTEHLNA